MLWTILGIVIPLGLVVYFAAIVVKNVTKLIQK